MCVDIWVASRGGACRVWVHNGVCMPVGCELQIGLCIEKVFGNEEVSGLNFRIGLGLGQVMHPNPFFFKKLFSQEKWAAYGPGQLSQQISY